jgi:aminoglycoside phosphotransferase
MKKLPTGIEENLQFLCVEVDSQVATLQQYLQESSHLFAQRIKDRAGYASNLKTRIHTVTANRLAKGVKRDSEKFILRCIEFIATDLEHIAEICRKCSQQVQQLDQHEVIATKPFINILKKVRRAIDLVLPAISDSNSEIAIEIGYINQAIKDDHQRLIKHYIELVQKEKNPSLLTQAMFIAYELKQFGEMLEHIGESIISANLGQPVNYERYFSLQSLFSAVDKTEDFGIEPIAETRSGSAISGVKSAKDDGYMAIFKDGEKKKLKEEKQGLNSWHDIYPGLAPKILSYKKKGESAALLIEHLPGYTLEHIIINERDELIKQALKHLRKTLASVWSETKHKKVSPAKFMLQLQKRLPDVYRIHPEFELAETTICGLELPSMAQLIEEAEVKEAKFKPPFSVYIHGDFNVDNIIFDPLEKRINFIDLHRSRYTDYVQDVAIFMVSNYRLQILDATRRKKIMAVALNVFKAAKRFARDQKDDTFEFRLALGLARAFATSTRFILDKALAKRMFLRAKYLIECVNHVDDNNVHLFTVSVEEIFVD